MPTDATPALDLPVPSREEEVICVPWHIAYDLAQAAGKLVIATDEQTALQEQRKMVNVAMRALADGRYLERALMPERDCRERGEDGWQPISTAPKDLTVFDVWISVSPSRGYRVANLRMTEGGSLFYADEHHPARLARWPTYWRPLPTPPDSTSQQAPRTEADGAVREALEGAFNDGFAFAEGRWCEGTPWYTYAVDRRRRDVDERFDALAQPDPQAAGSEVIYSPEPGFDIHATVVGSVEGWLELRFGDGSTCIVRPSRVRAALAAQASGEVG